VEYEITFGGAPQNVTITTSGTASANGLIGFVTDLVASPHYLPGMSILVDHMALDARSLSAADIQALADTVVRLDERIGESRVAIVVPNSLTFGFARMYEQRAARARLRSRVFYSRAEALAWLAEAVVPEPPDGSPERMEDPNLGPWGLGVGAGHPSVTGYLGVGGDDGDLAGPDPLAERDGRLSDLEYLGGGEAGCVQ
jgi:hypothetical protein